MLTIGEYCNGILNITGGGTVNCSRGGIGMVSFGNSVVNVDGVGSTWNCDYLGVGYKGSGTLNIVNGGSLRSSYSYVGYYSNSTGIAIVEGAGSTWVSQEEFYIGGPGVGLLEITNEGLVSIGGALTIDDDADGDSFINMSDGGMLALFGDADDSLSQFLDIVTGTDAIRWWDPAVGDWELLTTATMGEDYTLEYISDGGDLDGYTLLTVIAIEPGLGDADCDGDVDASDATILAGNWQAGPNATWSMGDFNGDGYVDASDATILANNWQAGTGAASVPEPSTVMLLGMLLLTAGLVRKRVKT
jgi:T5SS/PEP-CTERM-associated repeat protein